MNGRGWLGVLLMKCGYEYNKALELVDDLEMYAKSNGYTITIEKIDKQP